MGKGKALSFTLFAALGAVAGYATYMINKNKFSENTKDEYDRVLAKAKNVGTDIARTYTSIGDKKEFEGNTKNLSESALKLAKKAGDLVVSAGADMYNVAKEQITTAIDKYSTQYENSTKNTKTQTTKKTSAKAKKTNEKKPAKKTTKKTTKK